MGYPFRPGYTVNPYSTTTSTATLLTSTVSNTILASNTNRKYAIFVNDSDTVIYMSLASTATANNGIRLNANGGSYEITPTNLYTGIVSAYHSGAASKRVVYIEA